MGDVIRVSGKTIHDLQSVMALCREGSFIVPLLFENRGEDRTDAIAVVSAPYRIQRQRVLAFLIQLAGQADSQISDPIGSIGD